MAQMLAWFIYKVNVCTLKKNAWPFNIHKPIVMILARSILIDIELCYANIQNKIMDWLNACGYNSGVYINMLLFIIYYLVNFLVLIANVWLFLTLEEKIFL